jgi:hypothetical protein
MLCALEKARSLNCCLIQEIEAWNGLCFRKSQEPRLLSDTINRSMEECYVLQKEPGASTVT